MEVDAEDTVVNTVTDQSRGECAMEVDAREVELEEAGRVRMEVEVAERSEGATNEVDAMEIDGGESGTMAVDATMTDDVMEID